MYSVCIANYNGEKLLDGCLRSVLAQVSEIPFEIIVHDDASTDSSLEVLCKYQNVKVIKSETNVGFCVANNRMVECAAGEFILLLNNDAELFPDAVEKLFSLALTQPQGAILSLPQYDFVTGSAVDRGCALDFFYNPVPNLRLEISEPAMVIGACLWLPRELWIRLGGFPAWLESIGEDLYLCCAARAQGFTILCASESGYRHWQGKSFGGNRATASGLQTTYRRRFLSERNKTIVLITCTPTWIVWPWTTLHLLLLLGEGVLLSMLRLDKNILLKIYVASLCSAWSLRQHIHDTRHYVQSRRTISLWHYLRTFTTVPRKLKMLLQYGLPKVEN